MWRSEDNLRWYFFFHLETGSLVSAYTSYPAHELLGFSVSVTVSYYRGTDIPDISH